MARGKEPARLNFYRDSNQKEIDLVIEKSGTLHPIEIKKSANPDRSVVKTFAVLEKAGKPLGGGGIVCMSREPFPIDRQNCLIPAGLL